MLYAPDVRIIFRECEVQEDLTEEAIVGMTEAYIFAKQSGKKPMQNADWMEAFILFMGRMVKPEMNRDGYRQTPVVFANGNIGLAPEHINRAMADLCEAIVEGNVTPREAYIAFESVHPFKDGNGRIGHLLFRYLTKQQTGQWYVTLPEVDWSR